jgi:hypothetical protein
MFTGWSRLRSGRPGLPPGTRAWWQDNLDRLCDLEEASLAAIAGDCFVHGDVRSDNIMLLTGQHDVSAADDRVVFVDWTACSVGAAWLDLLCMAPSVQLEGGCSPSELFALAGVRVEPAQLVLAVAGLAGYFVWSGLRPPPPGMPTVRAVQRAKGEIALAWLRELLPRSGGGPLTR